MERHQNYSMKNEKHDFYVDVHTTYICTYVYVIRRLPFFLFFLFFFFVRGEILMDTPSPALLGSGEVVSDFTD